MFRALLADLSAGSDLVVRLYQRDHQQDDQKRILDQASAARIVEKERPEEHFTVLKKGPNVANAILGEPDCACDKAGFPALITIES